MPDHTGDCQQSPPKNSFASHFAVTATHGLSQIRFVDVSVAGCELWAQKQAALGWTVSHVWRFDGDNVFEIDDRKEQTQ